VLLSVLFRNFLYTQFSVNSVWTKFIGLGNSKWENSELEIPNWKILNWELEIRNWELEITNWELEIPSCEIIVNLYNFKPILTVPDPLYLDPFFFRFFSLITVYDSFARYLVCNSSMVVKNSPIRSDLKNFGLFV